jgi:hypothetical protein
MNRRNDVVAILEAIPWAILIGPASVLFTLYLTNRFNVAQFMRQRNQDTQVRHEAILRERTEELYVLLQEYRNLLGRTNISYLHVMEGKLDYNQALELVIQQNKDDIQFHRIQMLIDIYFPQHATAFAKLLDCRDEINDILAAHKRAYKSGESGKPFVNPFIAALTRAENAGNALVIDLVVETRRALSLCVG